jgi:hypothetical protein
MRSREEIEKKIAELREGARLARRKQAPYNLTFSLLLAGGIVLAGIGFSENIVLLVCMGFVIVITNVIVYLFIPKNSGEKKQDPYEVKTLEEVLDTIQAPDCEEEIYNSLREMVIQRCRGKADLLTIPFSGEAMYQQNEDAARFKALTWVADLEHDGGTVTNDKRVLRSHDGIRKKIKEIHFNIKQMKQRETNIHNVVGTIFLCTVMVFVIASVTGYHGLMAISGGLIYFYLMVIFIIYRLYGKKWSKQINKRGKIIAALDEALYLTATPQGREDIFMLLDEMLVEKGKSGRVNMARLEAFTWVASPGGLPGGKSEG